MKYTFKLRGKDVTIAAMDPVTALRPTVDLRGALSADKLIQRFGAAAEDDTRGGTAGPCSAGTKALTAGPAIC